MCRLLVSNLDCSTHRVLNVVIGTPKPSSRHYNIKIFLIKYALKIKNLCISTKICLFLISSLNTKYDFILNSKHYQMEMLNNNKVIKKFIVLIILFIIFSYN